VPPRKEAPQAPASEVYDILDDVLILSSISYAADLLKEEVRILQHPGRHNIFTYILFLLRRNSYI
jgi:hypothetical protein